MKLIAAVLLLSTSTGCLAIAMGVAGARRENNRQAAVADARRQAEFVDAGCGADGCVQWMAR